LHYFSKEKDIKDVVNKVGAVTITAIEYNAHVMIKDPL